MSSKKQDWVLFKIFERMGLLVAFFISWIVLVSTPIDLFMVYSDPMYLIKMHNAMPGIMGSFDWLNMFFSYWRELWQWPVIFYSIFFLIGRIIFKDWKKTNLLIWVTFVIAYLNLIFFNSGLQIEKVTITIGEFILYPMIILAPANINIYPEFGALLFIAAYDLLKRSGFDTSLSLIIKGDKKKNVLDKVVSPDI